MSNRDLDHGSTRLIDRLDSACRRQIRLNLQLASRLAACSECLSRAAERDGGLKWALELEEVLRGVRMDILLAIERDKEAAVLGETVDVITRALEGGR